MPISLLLEYSLPVVGIELCLVWMIVHYLLEPFVMPKVFGPAYISMDIVARRSLTNHVVSFFLKILCCCGAYAIWQALVVQQPFDAHIKKTNGRYTLTIGDFLAFCYLTVPTIYIFELIYRANISIVSAIHHVGAITINIMGLIIILGHEQRGFLAETEFKLILIYGTFEMIFEVWPHLAVMLYRILRHRPSFLHKVFLCTACCIFTGTFLEQIAIGVFYHHVWTRLPASYKALGLILHVCFMMAQLHGGRVCLQIARKMSAEMKTQNDLRQKELAADGAETPITDEDSSIDLEIGLKTEQQRTVRRSLLLGDSEKGIKHTNGSGPAPITTHAPTLQMDLPGGGLDVTHVRY
ncbi:hypothetical protein FPV67DRAFT_1668795 [Lyophyllum atratum]|nr:hypothetical protein FPV67DRAFT_1668795 [Lyophyllum atratum]